MKKIVVMLIVVMVIGIGFFSGCNEQNNVSDGTNSLDNNQNNGNESYPKAYAFSSRKAGVAPLFVNFTGEGVDDDGYIVSYFWDFDDGNTSTMQTVNHTFFLPGTYNITFTVTDDEGNTGMDYILIIVSGSSGGDGETEGTVFELFENWESAVVGIYNVKMTEKVEDGDNYIYKHEYDYIEGDAGTWKVMDNYYGYFNNFPDKYSNPMESSPNIAEIISSQGNEYLFMDVPIPYDGIPIMRVEFYDKLEIPLTENTIISFEGSYQSFEALFSSDGNYSGSYRITLELLVGEETIYYSLYDDSKNQWGHYTKYDVILVNPGLTTRNVFNDFTKEFGYKYTGDEKITGVTFLVHYPGQATFDNIHIYN